MTFAKTKRKPVLNVNFTLSTSSTHIRTFYLLEFAIPESLGPDLTCIYHGRFTIWTCVSVAYPAQERIGVEGIKRAK